MNPPFVDDLSALRARTSLKWRAYPSDVLPLWVAEMDVTLAEPVAAALHDAVARGDTGYPAGRAYAEALASFAADRWDWEVDVGRTAIVPDVMLGLMEVLKLVTVPGDAVVVNCPVYPPFYAFVESLDRRIVEAPLTRTHRIDLTTLEAAFVEASAGGRSAAYLLCSPHNPTGTVHSRDELEAVAALADRHGVRVVVDEIHAPLVLPGAQFTPYLAVAGGERGMTVLSASKGWNLAGLKAALVVAGSAVVEDLARMPEEVGHGPSHLGIIAHSAALRSGGPWLDRLLAGLDNNRTLLAELLASRLPMLGYRPGAATYLAWLDCAALGLEAEPDPMSPRGDIHATTGPVGFFLERAKVALSPGSSFGTGGRSHVRLNYATSPRILTEAIERMAAAVEHRS